MDCCVRSCIYLIVIVCGLWWGIVCGIDCFGRTMSPKGAILLHSPGRKPWVNHWNIFIEPRRGGTIISSWGYNCCNIQATILPLLP